MECGCDKVRMLDLPSPQSGTNGYYDKTNTVQVSFSYLVQNEKTILSHLNTLLEKVTGRSLTKVRLISVQILLDNGKKLASFQSNYKAYPCITLNPILYSQVFHCL